MAKRQTQYVRVPLPPGRMAQLRRLADEERRTLGQMAALMVIDQLPEEASRSGHFNGPWRSPNLIPAGGCQHCGADRIGLEATVAQLLTALDNLREGYGWVSEELVVRRLRVPLTLARWLLHPT